MKKTLSAILLCLLFISVRTSAQTSSGATETTFSQDYIRKNFVKLNVTALFVKNYSLQYERVINKSISLAISYRNMPESSLPFKQALKDAAADDGDQETVDAIEKLRMSNYAITPELRFYVGKKGYGQGFYIAPFYRYAAFKANNIAFKYGDNSAFQNEIALAGKLTANTGGIMFGAQWALSKVIVLDWWILGPHYGGGHGTFSGVSGRPLTETEQQELRNELEDIDIPLTDKTIIVNSAGATMKLDGPWGGVRGGLCLAIKF